MNNTIYEFTETCVGYKSSSRLEKHKIAELLFYNIVINYSHYGLNSREVGHWIKAIFHKNDAYQTPIVLAPFRDNGIIDINKENYLVRSRLLVNILENVTGIFSFGNKEKNPTQIKLELDTSKFRLRKGTQKIVLIRTHSSKKFVLPTVFEILFENKDFTPNNDPVYDYAIEYILNKIYSISLKYKHYNKYKGFSSQRNNEMLLAYLKELKEDSSHITYKLKQAVNFLQFNIYPKTFTNSLEVISISSKISELKEKYDIPSIELVPPPFFKIDIEFGNYGDHFSKFSSGERQKIYAYSSVIYHLRNLDSILRNTPQKGKSSEKLLRYKHVNIIFDEIELYYHPDLQRRFIKDLLNSIRSANLKLISSINFIFITHSPFILSDIPSEQTIYLDLIDQKSTQRFPQGNTFGGNIHDLLANNFFLDEEGYIGENAKEILTNAYEYLLSVINRNGKYIGDESINGWTKTKARKVIDLTGENLIKSSLNELYSQAFLRSKSDIELEIERLNNLKNKVKKTT